VPLPDSTKTAWPPEPLAPVFERIASWSAWYSGHPDELVDVYGALQSEGFDSVSRARVVDRPSQFRGGVVGRLARWFWGTPTPLGERRTKLHIPIAGDMAAKSSKLLFSEPLVFKVDDEGENVTTTQDRLNELVDDSVHVALLEAGEVGAALGGVYLRIVWDPELRARPWITAVHADAAVPEWRWDRLAAVTFWRVLEQSGQHVVRHLERHEPGAVWHGVYEGNDRELGRQVPLIAYADTATIAQYAADEQRVGDMVRIDTGIPGRLTAGYVPNMRPNRVWRNLPAGANLGRSDFQGVEPEMDALDEVWTSWMRDIRLAKGRAFVPDVYLQSNGPGQGATWDAEREIYSTLNMLPQPGAGQQITLHQFAIRVEEHARSAEELLNIVARGAGYSAQSFGLTGDTAVTATEVVARERDSYLTRGHKILYWRPELAEIVETLLAVDAVKFGSGVTPQRPHIEWPDGVAEDPEKVARTLQLLHAAEALSIQTRVERANPDWDEDRVLEEVRRIRNEQGTATADPVEFTRSIAGNRPPPEPLEAEPREPDEG
jgi:hypothetical protein